MSANKMRVLITGSEGLIGRKLVQYYKSLGDDVIGYDWEKDEKGEHWHWDTIKEKQFDVIHHCASQCVVREVIQNPSQSYQNNQITYRIMELARFKPPNQLFLYSSNRVTSNIENPYVTSKKYMEQLALGYKNCYNLDSIIIRPETIWGYKFGDIRVMPQWIESAIKGDDLIIYGDENKELSPLYINYFMNVIKEMCINYNKYKNQTWTITGQTKLAKDICEIIIKYFDSPSKIVFKNAEKTQPQKIIKRENEFRLLNLIEIDIKKYEEEKK